MLLWVGFAFLIGWGVVVNLLSRTVDVTRVELGMSTRGETVVFWLGALVPAELELGRGMVVLMVPATEREIVASMLPATFFALQL